MIEQPQDAPSTQGAGDSLPFKVWHDHRVLTHDHTPAHTELTHPVLIPKPRRIHKILERDETNMSAKSPVKDLAVPFAAPFLFHTRVGYVSFLIL